MPSREHWLDIARKVDWDYRYVTEEEVFPTEISGSPWLAHAAWAEWNEAYRTTYREYVANQRSKDESVMGVRSVLSKSHSGKNSIPGWVQLLKFHYGALALAEYAGRGGRTADGPLRPRQRLAHDGDTGCARRDPAHADPVTARPRPPGTRRQLRLDTPGLPHHEWLMIAARHLFDDMFLAADAIEVAVQLNFVFETGFTNLQFMAMAAMADSAHDHLFEKALTSIQTDEARHAQIGHPVATHTHRQRRGTAGSIPRRQDVVALLAGVNRTHRHGHGVPDTGRGTHEVVPPIHGGMDHRPVHEEPGRVRPRAPLVLGAVPRGAGLRPPQPATRPLRVPHHPLVRRRHARRRQSGLWLASAYPQWEETFGTLWDEVERAWETKGEPGTLGYALPALCNLCQLPTVFVRPGQNTACTTRRTVGVIYSVLSPAAGSSCRS